jgi:spore coat protein JB
MNELYYMGLDNCNYLTSSDINYPQYANYRQNKTMFTNPNEGFLKGNIQNNIYKPYKSYAPGNISVNNEKDRLLVEIQMYGFYLTDLGLYLDTHPNDMEALNLFNETRNTYYKKLGDFNRQYYPLCSFNSDKKDSYEWIEGKFPWTRGN